MNYANEIQRLHNERAELEAKLDKLRSKLAHYDQCDLEALTDFLHGSLCPKPHEVSFINRCQYYETEYEQETWMHRGKLTQEWALKYGISNRAILELIEAITS